MIKFKIDLNSYDSITYPFALWKWESRWCGGRWKHFESFKTKEEAMECYNRIAPNYEGLPIYLGGES